MTEHIDRDALRKLTDAATEGPWEVPHSCDASVDYVTAPADDNLCGPVCDVRSPVRNAEFIAAARTAVPALLDALDQAEARIKAVRDVHRRFGIYEHEDACTNTTDEHREEHHHEDSDSSGEYYCDQMPIGAVCDHCRDEDGERADWPCPTIRALDCDSSS